MISKTSQVRKYSGIALTAIGCALIIYAIAVGGLYGTIIGVSAYLATIGWLCIMMGPWLWYGEVPRAVLERVKAQIARLKRAER